MPNCKVGDRAMITAPQNYGKQCIILEDYTSVLWLVEALEPVVANEMGTIIRVAAGYHGTVDKRLVVPLSDPDQDIIETNKELEMM